MAALMFSVVELTGAYAEALALLRKQKEPMNGADLARLAGVETTAMCNRLTWLAGHGLAIGERYGRQRRWRDTEAG